MILPVVAIDRVNIKEIITKLEEAKLCRNINNLTNSCTLSPDFDNDRVSRKYL